jgi:hypothetical protein
LNELIETRSETWGAASQTLSGVETWLRDGRPHGTTLLDYDGPEPKLAKGESLTDAIERLRRRGRELKADLHRIRSAPYPSAHVRAKIKQEVEALATRGKPIVSDAVEHDRGLVWPTQALQGTIINAQAKFCEHRSA